MEMVVTHQHDEITFWEKIAKTKWGRYISEIEKEAILKAHNLIIRPATALEVGCEGGRWSKLLSDSGWRMICMDIDQRVLNICKNRIPTTNCILVNPDDSKLPCDTENIGLILCIEVAPVIKSDWFIDEALRVLQAGGLIVGVFLNRLSWRGLILHRLASLRGSYDYYELSYPAWRKKFCEKGFTVVHEKGFCWPPFRRSSNSPLVPIATHLEYYLGLRKLASISPWIVFVAQKIGD